jgi:prepilin-type N-terminal cleavage/methylation domain-containing protein
MNSGRTRGVSLIESLVAALIMGICLMGVVALWTFSHNITTNHDQTSVGYNLARRGMELVKQQGFKMAEYSSSSPLVYYYLSDGTGETPFPSGNVTYGYKSTITVVSDRMDVNVSTGVKKPSDSALRTVTVIVTSLPDNKERARVASLLVRGGT